MKLKFRRICKFSLTGTGIIFLSGYVYRPDGKPDPFAPLSLIRPTIEGATRLQQHNISEFELVGTMLGKEPAALLMTPNPREGIIARVGDRIGKHGGRVVSISRDRLLAREPSSKSIAGENIEFSDVAIPLSKVSVNEPVKEQSE